MRFHLYKNVNTKPIITINCIMPLNNMQIYLHDIDWRKTDKLINNNNKHEI